MINVQNMNFVAKLIEETDMGDFQWFNKNIKILEEKL